MVRLRKKVIGTVTEILENSSDIIQMVKSLKNLILTNLEKEMERKPIEMKKARQFLLLK